MENSENQIIYSRNVIELITVANEICIFFENATSLDKKDFLDRGLKLLPLLYLKMSLTQMPKDKKEDDDLETFVTENDYNAVKDNIAILLGESDRYLTIPLSNDNQSEESLAADISEDLADIYQDIKDFLSRYQIGNENIMNDALIECINLFHSHWGTHLISAMHAMHYVHYNDIKGNDNEQQYDYEHNNQNNFNKEEHPISKMRESFFNHQINDKGKEEKRN